MSDFEAPEAAKSGRTRWSRVGLMLASSAAAGAVVIGLTAQGVIAAQFAISGQPFTVTSTSLQGQGFEQFAVLDNMAGGANNPNAGSSGGQVVLVTSAINSATLANLCQSVALPGEFLKITAGGGSNPVKASTLIVDSDSLSGDASFTNISIDQDPSTFTEVPNVTGPLGTFGQQADSVTINNLRQDNFATTAASFSLPGLSLAFSQTGC
jgi:hypothetical protein